ncbi:hypothetical protein [Sulfurospirillum arcachonense]|uniref:hypothetical protein n=1 Tax=Sulfurospirillum arcachonense TaxID=57666 RepID=UPI00046A20AF|nr:hypothetical protein [Sulfurospirillum arcachonense]
MKKIMLGLIIIANSLFAISINDINGKMHKRAYITRVDLVNDNQTAAKLILVSYPNINKPESNDYFKYDSERSQWIYTHGDSNYYYYSSYWDSFFNNTNVHTAYVYVNMQGYSIDSSSANVMVLWGNGYIDKQHQLQYLQTLSDGTKVFIHENATNLLGYSVRTQIIANDGTVDLYSYVSVDPYAKE